MDDIRINWDSVFGVAGYNVYLKKGIGDYLKQNDSLITGTETYIYDLEPGTYSLFITAIKNTNESLASNIVSFIIVNEGNILFSENFDDETDLPHPWIDPNNEDPIAGGNVTVRGSEIGFTSNAVQISYIAWNIGNGMFPGTKRLEHPFNYFHLVEPVKSAELSVDWYFEDVWDWNTIARDRDEMVSRLIAHGRFDGGNKITYTQQQAEAYVDSILGSDIDQVGPSNPYYLTGFPYQTGKMHGLISAHDNAAPSGSNPREANEWSARVVWVKNTSTHPTQDGGGVYTDGADPDVPPKLAIYLYDQDRDPEGDGGEPGRFVILDDFTTLQQNTWYTIKLFVQLNDPGQRNGIARLTVIDRATQNVLGEVVDDNVKFHDAANIEDAYIHRMMFSTFFGGGNIRYQPQIDPDWIDLPNIDVNSGVYARNDNFVVTKIAHIEAPLITSATYVNDELNVVLSSFDYSLNDIDDIEVNVVGVGQQYNPDNWISVNYELQGGNPDADIDPINVVTGQTVYFRVDIGGDKSSKSEPIEVQVPTVPDPPSGPSIVDEGDQSFSFFFNGDENTGNSPITDYQYRLNGGTPVSIGVLGTEIDTLRRVDVTEDNGSPLVNGQEYVVELRAENANGFSDWGLSSSAFPVAPYQAPIPTQDLVRLYDVGQITGADHGDRTTLPDMSVNDALMSGMTGALRPLYRNIGGPNDEPWLRVRTIDPGGLEDTGEGLDDLSDEISIYTVVRSISNDQRGSIFATTPWDSDNILNIHSPYTLGNGDLKVAWDYGQRFDGSGGLVGRILEDYPNVLNSWHIWEYRVDFVNEEMTIYVDGVEQYRVNRSSGVNFPFGGNTKLRIGWSPDGWWDGGFAFACIYSRHHYDREGDRIDILTYLQNRFGIPCTIPSEGTPVINDFALQSVGTTTLTFSFDVDGKGLPSWIEYRVDGGAWTGSGADTTGGTGTFTIGGLTTGQEYSVEIRFNTLNGSRTSDPVLGTPAIAPPEITSFSLNEAGEDFLTFNYSTNPNGEDINSIRYKLDSASYVIVPGLTSQTGQFTISGLDVGEQYNVRMRVFTDGGIATSNNIQATTLTGEVVYPPPVQPLSQKLCGMWESNDEHYGNMLWELSAGSARNSYENLFPGLPIGFNNSFDSPQQGGTVAQWRSKLENMRSSIYAIGEEDLITINLQDEPYPGYNGSWTTPQLEDLVEEAQRVINSGGRQYRFSFTIRESNAKKPIEERPLPQNIDYIGVNYYPFDAGDDNAFKERYFASRADKVFDPLMSKLAVRTRIFMVAAGWYHDTGNPATDYDLKPPDNSPFWYADYVINHPRIDFMLYWKYRASHNYYVTLDEMPTVWNNVKAAYDQYFLD